VRLDPARHERRGGGRHPLGGHADLERRRGPEGPHGPLRIILEITADLAAGNLAVASFGEDASGEVYLVMLSGEIFRLDPE